MVMFGVASGAEPAVNGGCGSEQWRAGSGTLACRPQQCPVRSGQLAVVSAAGFEPAHTKISRVGLPDARVKPAEGGDALGDHRLPFRSLARWGGGVSKRGCGRETCGGPARRGAGALVISPPAAPIGCTGRTP